MSLYRYTDTTIQNSIKSSTSLLSITPIKSIKDQRLGSTVALGNIKAATMLRPSLSIVVFVSLDKQRKKKL